MNGCTRTRCECCAFCHLLSRTAIPDVVFKENKLIVDRLEDCAKWIFHRCGAKIGEWLSCHHGWIAAFSIGSEEHIAFAVYGITIPLVFKWVQFGIPANVEPGSVFFNAGILDPDAKSPLLIDPQSPI